MQETFGVTLPFFALILSGYIARWRGVMGDGSAKVLNNFVLYFALPALLVRTLAGVSVVSLLDTKFLTAWISVGAVLFIIALIVAIIAGRQSKQQAIIQAFASTHGNIGYLGITLVVGVLGNQAIAAVSMAIVADFVVIVPITLALLELLENYSNSVLRTLRDLLWALVVNPFVVAIFMGLLLSYTQIGFAKGVDDFLRILGMAAVPTALFAIGVTLYGQPIGAAWVEISILCIVKLVVHPIMIFIVTSYFFDLANNLIIAATLLAALPIANNVFIIATRFDVHPNMISSAILISTTAALATFNIWASLLMP